MPGLEDFIKGKGAIQRDVPIYKDKNGKIVQGPRYGDFLGMGGEDSKSYSRVTFENGETWDIPEDPNDPTAMSDFNSSMAAAWRAKNPSQTAQWSLREGKDGKTYRVNELTGEALEVKGLPAPKEPADKPIYADDFRVGNKLYRYDANGQPQLISEFPEEPKTPALGRQQTQDELNKQRWDALKAQQDVEGTAPMNPYQVAMMEREAERDAYTQTRNTAQDAYTQERNAAQDAYKREQDQLAREQWERQQALVKQQQAWKMAVDSMSQQAAIAPYAQIPGQTHFLGYEPGGSWSKLYPQLGLPFNPDRFKAPIIQFDPDAEYAKWQAAMGGK